MLSSYSGPALLCKRGLINILSYFKHRISVKITACFLIGLLEKLRITGKNEGAEPPLSVCRGKLTRHQVFTGNRRCIRRVSRWTTAFAWRPLCLRSSPRAKNQYFHFTDGNLGRGVVQFTPTLRTEIRQILVGAGSQTTHLK